MEYTCMIPFNIKYTSQNHNKRKTYNIHATRYNITASMGEYTKTKMYRLENFPTEFFFLIHIENVLYEVENMLQTGENGVKSDSSS